MSSIIVWSSERLRVGSATWFNGSFKCCRNQKLYFTNWLKIIYYFTNYIFCIGSFSENRWKRGSDLTYSSFNNIFNLLNYLSWSLFYIKRLKYFLVCFYPLSLTNITTEKRTRTWGLETLVTIQLHLVDLDWDFEKCGPSTYVHQEQNGEPYCWNHIHSWGLKCLSWLKKILLE